MDIIQKNIYRYLTEKEKCEYRLIVAKKIIKKWRARNKSKTTKHNGIRSDWGKKTHIRLSVEEHSIWFKCLKYEFKQFQYKHKYAI